MYAGDGVLGLVESDGRGDLFVVGQTEKHALVGGHQFAGLVVIGQCTFVGTCTLAGLRRNVHGLTLRFGGWVLS